MRSPLSISYNDLIEATEKRLSWMQQSYPGKVLSGQLNEWSASHNIAVQKKLLQLLKKCKREKQMDLFEVFEKMR